MIKTDQSNGSQTTYGYDNADRLTQLVNTASSKTLAGYQYTLDANGNRTQSVETETHLPEKLINNAQSYSYNTPKNRLTNASSAVLTYDNEGQLLTQGSTRYAFDYARRLISQGTSSYIYDGAGNRIQATRNGTVTKYIYDATGNLLAEANASNTITRYYIYGHGLMAMVDATSNQLYVYHFDGTGHTVAITNASQQTVNTYAYDPYGKIMAQQETVPQPFKYAGQVGIIDEGNNLYYMRARYYDANVGRFISEDPAGFAGGLNLYAYVGGNPILLVDPSGLGAERAGISKTQIAQFQQDAFDIVIGFALPVSKVGRLIEGVAGDFFAGTKYTDKVLGQMKQGDFHAFPESVKAFQDAGQVNKITGGDGVARELLKIPGEYQGKQGAFEFIKEADGSINHRLFRSGQ